MPRHCLAAHRSGAISIMFATMVIPLLLIVGLAIDFGFYVRAQAQLNLAADSAAMHAVRAAALATQNGAPSNTGQNGGTSSGNTNWNYAGVRAGQEWFTSQATLVKGFTSSTSASTESSPQSTSQALMGVGVTVTYSVPTYTATVTYSGTMNTIFGKIAGVKNWPIGGTATAAIGYNYVDIGIMIDNSQSMLIGATQDDINTMNAATPCAVVTPYKDSAGNMKYPGLNMWAYSYYFDGLNGNVTSQGTYGYVAGQTLPPYSTSTTATTSGMQCDPNFTALSGSACAYPPAIIYGVSGVYGTTGGFYTTAAKATASVPQGACNNGGGSPGNSAAGIVGAHTPQAPCAFACHENAAGGDLYALARSTTNLKTGNKVQLRLDVVQSAAQQVIATMEQYSPPPQTLLGVGVYTFNENLNPVYPCTSLTSCTSPYGTDLPTAYSGLAVCTGTATTGCLAPPVSGDFSDTYFANVFKQAATFLAGTAGDGSTSAKAMKNLFIITDGVNDWPMNGSSPAAVPASITTSPGGIQLVGPMDQILDSQGRNPCAQIKDQGITIYVLYTPYYPIPTWTYSYYTMPQPGSSYPAGVTYPTGITLGTFATEADPMTFPNYNANYPNDTPIQAALRKCASSPGNLYVASSPSDITTAMQAMLAAALNSAARVTQ